MKRLLISVLLFILVPCQQKINLDVGIFDGEDTAVSWITVLADNAPLTCVSIPRAYDAATATGQEGS